jgi:hypothetical protein
LFVRSAGRWPPTRSSAAKAARFDRCPSSKGIVEKNWAAMTAASAKCNLRSPIIGAVVQICARNVPEKDDKDRPRFFKVENSSRSVGLARAQNSIVDKPSLARGRRELNHNNRPAALTAARGGVHLGGHLAIRMLWHDQMSVVSQNGGRRKPQKTTGPSVTIYALGGLRPAREYRNVKLQLHNGRRSGGHSNLVECAYFERRPTRILAPSSLDKDANDANCAANPARCGQN